MKKSLILLACILTSIFSYTQIGFQKTYGGIGFNQGFSVVQTSDGGYAVTGNKSNADVYLIRTNLYGDTLWTKTYGESLNDYGYSIVQTNDDGFMITGGKFIENFFHVYLIKTNSTGDTLWTKTYGKNDVNSLGNSVIQLNDNGYIISGYTDNKSQGGLCSIYLLRTNESGDTIWTKKITGDYGEYGYYIIQTNDNGYAVVGRIGSKIILLKITTDRQNLNFVGFYFYLFVYQLLAVFIFVLLKTYPLSK